jgi:4-alpha-glucanotransferase
MMKNQRKAGILMPISSLPAPYGIGTLGEGAYQFVDWLSEAGLKIWQVLPLLPTAYGNSPYQSCASNALNYYLIDFDVLAQEGLLDRSEYASVDWGTNAKRVDYGKLFAHKIDVLKKAFARFNREEQAWKDFLAKGEYADFALFMSLKIKFGYRAWSEWGEYCRYDEQKAAAYIAQQKEDIEFWQFTQYLFLKQWNKLKGYANAKGVQIMGDMPIYVAADSVEMWKYGKELFLLDKNGDPALVAGVPPDAFSEDGQLWGNPVYDWEKMKKNDYGWWRKRIKDAFRLFDIVRIDHFRGFDRFYAIPKDSKNAKNGEWLDGPKAELFRGFENSSIIAEDLGIIDDGVRQLLKQTGYAGMKVAAFGFDGNPECEHKPSNYTENYVAYTGTHDNEPMLAYIENLNTEWEKPRFEQELDTECEKLGVPSCGPSAVEQCKTLISLLFASRANTVIFPMHDVLVLGKEARINCPSVLSSDNWSYRYTKEDFDEKTVAWLRSFVNKYNR